jgi:hypothetical protein
MESRLRHHVPDGLNGSSQGSSEREGETMRIAFVLIRTEAGSAPTVLRDLKKLKEWKIPISSTVFTTLLPKSKLILSINSETLLLRASEG